MVSINLRKIIPRFRFTRQNDIASDRIFSDENLFAGESKNRRQTNRLTAAIHK
jgi:hypothetical protein